MAPDPSLNPLPPLYALQTCLTLAGGVAFRSYLYLDPAAAKAMGERLEAEKPSEVTSLTYKVVQLEGAPS